MHVTECNIFFQCQIIEKGPITSHNLCKDKLSTFGSTTEAHSDIQCYIKQSSATQKGPRTSNSARTSKTKANKSIATTIIYFVKPRKF